MPYLGRRLQLAKGWLDYAVHHYYLSSGGVRTYTKSHLLPDLTNLAYCRQEIAAAVENYQYVSI